MVVDTAGRRTTSNEVAHKQFAMLSASTTLLAKTQGMAGRDTGAQRYVGLEIGAQIVDRGCGGGALSVTLFPHTKQHLNRQSTQSTIPITDHPSHNSLCFSKKIIVSYTKLYL